MKIIYVDESGSTSMRHQSRYFVVSGVILDVGDFDSMEEAVRSFKDKMFKGQIEGNEIHVYDIAKGKNGFKGIMEDERRQIILEAYMMASSLRFSIITVAVDKLALKSSQHTDEKIIRMAYDSFVTRFDQYIRKTQDKGVIMFDKISSRPYALSKIDVAVMDFSKKAIRRGVEYKHTRSIIIDPIFGRSDEEAGLQIADLVAYGTNQFLNNNEDFARCWDLIYPKIQSRQDGKIDGYGLTVFPHA